MTDDEVVDERVSQGCINCTHISYVDPISRSIRKNDFLDKKILERRLVEDLND